MKHLIQHTTRYHYTAPVNYSIQKLRLTPRTDLHQRTRRWQIDAPGELHRQTDAYGNITHTLTLNKPHEDIELRVSGTRKSRLMRLPRSLMRPRKFSR